MPKKSEMHEFKMDLFNNGYPEEFLWFQQNYRMTLDELATYESFYVVKRYVILKLYGLR